MKNLALNWKYTLAEGIVLLLLGLFAFARPVLTTYSLALVAGWILIVMGILAGYRAIRDRGEEDFLVSLITAVLFFVLGILMVNHPVATIFTLTGLVTAFLAIDGISKIVLFFKLHSFDFRWLLIFSGILSLLLAALVWIGWPDTTHWFIGLMFAINLIFAGLTLIIISWKARNLQEVD